MTTLVDRKDCFKLNCDHTHIVGQVRAQVFSDSSLLSQDERGLTRLDPERKVMYNGKNMAEWAETLTDLTDQERSGMHLYDRFAG